MKVDSKEADRTRKQGREAERQADFHGAKEPTRTVTDSSVLGSTNTTQEFTFAITPAHAGSRQRQRCGRRFRGASGCGMSNNRAGARAAGGQSGDPRRREARAADRRGAGTKKDGVDITEDCPHRGGRQFRTNVPRLRRRRRCRRVEAAREHHANRSAQGEDGPVLQRG